MRDIEVSAPGRICLFGEHQDYLSLPVITAAIDLHISITGQQRNDHNFTLNLPDINTSEQFSIPLPGKELIYTKDRDYFRSVFNVLVREGAHFDKGWDCTVLGNIPINSGTSSSSALCVAWTRFLVKASTVQKPQFGDQAQIARIAYEAEVEEFGEPGGMMDQNAIAMGGLLFQDLSKPATFKKLPSNLGSFVLGDSLEPKDTINILKRVKLGVLDAVAKIKHENISFNLETTLLEELTLYKTLLTNSQFEVLQGAILNRNLTQQALKMFNTEPFNERTFGELLNKHQKVLAENVRTSTPKIDRMLKAAIKAGAYGGKVNGSGGGGCMFAYAPNHTKEIAQAINREGGQAFIIKAVESSMPDC